MPRPVREGHNRTTDMHVLEKSDCAVVPVNQPNKGGQLPAEVGEGRAQLKEMLSFALGLRGLGGSHRAGTVWASSSRAISSEVCCWIWRGCRVTFAIWNTG